MRLLRTDSSDLKLVTFKNERNLPAYAILSHTWLEDEEEVTFEDLSRIDGAKTKRGWEKLAFATSQASSDGLEYIWIDTCCIDKASSAELAESINSMYRWYQRAAVCYVYLCDMPTPGLRGFSNPRTCGSTVDTTPTLDTLALSKESLTDVRSNYQRLAVDDKPSDVLLASRNDSQRVPGKTGALQHENAQDCNSSIELGLTSVRPDLQSAEGSTLSISDTVWFKTCRWFTRGWTLQEMLAPSDVRFFSSTWMLIGTLNVLTDLVTSITGIHPEALSRKRPLSSFSVAQKMCWAANRQTTRIEDQAYSLLGIFDISLPIIYGEGEASFVRMQEEILRVYPDHTIFAWSMRPDCWATLNSKRARGSSSSGLLATSASAFRNCGRLVPVKMYQTHQAYEFTSRAVTFFDLPIFDSGMGFSRALLNCHFENDCTREVAIKLYPTTAPDTYTVAEDTTEPRIEMADTYVMSLMSKPKLKRRFNVVRHAVRFDAIEHGGMRSHQIMCRLKVSNNYQPVAPSFTLAPCGYINAGHWDAETESFHLHCNCRNYDEPCSGVFEGVLELRRHYTRLGKLKIAKRHDLTIDSGFLEERQVEFEREEKSKWKWNQLPTAILPRRISIYGGVIMAANYQRCSLLHDNVELVEISIYTTGEMFAQCIWRVLASFIMLTLCVLQISAFAPSVAIPIAAIALYQARTEGTLYNQDYSSSLPDQSLLLGLKIALPLSCLLSIGVLFKRDRIFGAEPTSQTTASTPLGIMGAHFRYHHRMMLFTLTILQNIALATMSIVLASHSRKHASLFHEKAVMETTSTGLRLGLYASLPAWAAVSAVLATVLVFMFIFNTPNSRFTFLKSAGGKTAVTAILFHTVAIVPFAMISRLSILTPWTKNDCYNGSFDEDIIAFYNEMDSISGIGVHQWCTSLALEGKLVVSILSLSVYDIIVNIWTAGYIAWRISQLRIDAKKKIALF